ncbi:BcABA1, cytochrome P450 monooxygenase [Colletotrichum phormii]|uniref:BcABA1, cytochrome P450 monooxygenase n=1 Tax=Colletotrichum phormii TaxID=359342 RepID=A0AAJ0EGS2_9PEZI|nr:BcABA1, cytochrome P450 monooxygenase [Colletotrichum phormii]KAK1638423.1 BcABA1, cytochrome P450 monooxygenase [Colletotrichum phormii]
MALPNLPSPSLSPLQWLSLTLTLLTLTYALTSLRTYTRLRHIPSSSPLSNISYVPLFLLARSARQEELYRTLNTRLASRLVRVGPNELLTDDPSVLRRINAVRSDYGKDSWYFSSRFNPYQETMFTTLDKEGHDRMKAKTAAAYAGREVHLLEPSVDVQVVGLVRLLRERYAYPAGGGGGGGGGKLVDMGVLPAYLTMDVITTAAFGRPFGHLEADADVFGFIRQMRDNWPLIAITLDTPWIRTVRFSKLFLRWLGPRTTDKIGLGQMMGIAEKYVGERFKSTSKPQKDMLGSWIKNGMTQQECEAEGLFALVAGSDTTASVIRITMLHLMCNPRIYHKFKGVIRDAVASGVSTPITFDQGSKIPFLRALIYEGIRIRAPATGLYPKTVPPQGDTIDGKFIPGGTAIGMNAPGLLKSPALFGEDAELFRPERFLEVDDAARMSMERDVEMAFGYGRYMCAGKPVAFMELYKAFFELMRNFDFELADPVRPWDSFSYNIFVEENMWTKVTISDTS